MTKIRNFYPSNPYNSKGTFSGLLVEAAAKKNHIETDSITGKDPLSDALRRQVLEIMARTVSDIKSTLRKYININAYSLTGIMPEILFFNRWAELAERLLATGMPMCKPEILSSDERSCTFSGIYNLKLAINKLRGEESQRLSKIFKTATRRRYRRKIRSHF